MNKEASYILTVTPLPDDSDPGGIRRLRRLLKAMVRSWRLRCTAIKPAVSTPEREPPAGGRTTDRPRPAATAKSASVTDSDSVSLATATN
ncbi:MAG: hypothetical protein ACR2FY_14665 [Pirellulaceae bacterium]